jgi:diaminohydroxyphosphoribosylaminopyrimidine deaminase/5-amino-6-(5-phosphoribosylamino)uracil reductase
MGCVLVGAGTVIADDPELTARLDGVRNQPLRVVLDPRVRLKGDERVLSDPSKTLWLRGDDALNVPTVLARLYALGQTGVLVEGGAWTLSQFMGSGMWDRLDLFVAPKLLGNGPAWVNLGGDEGLRLPVTSVTPVGDDLHLVIQNPNAVGPVPGKQ